MANGINFPSWTTNSDTSITATTPPLTPGRHTVFVETNVGRSPSGVGAEVVAMDQPTLTDVSPANGPDSGGTPVVLTGSGFLNPDDLTPAVSEVRFDGTAATSVVVVSNTVIQCVTPAGTGEVDVEVDNYVGTGTLSAGYNFDATSNAPTITSVSPSSGTISGGFEVRLIGTDFVGITAVNVDGSPVTHVVDSPTRITIPSMPSHAAGAINIQVVNAYGNDTIAFTYAVEAVAVQAMKAGGTLFSHGSAFEYQITYGVFAADFTIQDDRELIAADDVTTALQVELINALASDKPLLANGLINAIVPELLREPGRVTRKDSKTIHIETVVTGYNLANGTDETISLLLPDSWVL